MIPNLFSKYPLEKRTPRRLASIIERLRRTKSKEECLRTAYDLLSEQYYGERVKTYLYTHRLFSCDARRLSRLHGFLHCHHLNYLLRTVLVKSGKFSDDDIEQKLCMVWYLSPHQYCRVRVGRNKHIDVDIWAKRFGIPLGSHAHGFS